MDKYEKGEVLGEGTYGSVFKAICKETGQTVALKKIRMAYNNNQMSATAEREVDMLKRMASSHVVELLDVFPHKKNLYLVFEYLETDLEAVVKCKSLKLLPADIKSLLQMLLKGLCHLHNHNVVHRDVKPDNILLSQAGQLKLADFGLARLIENPEDKRTNQVFMRWYRAPEILYGSTKYGPEADIWAAGCVFAELLLRRPWFAGSSDIDQLSKIFAALGQPRPEDWPGLKDLPTYMEFRLAAPRPLAEQFPGVSEEALDLLRRMVCCDPDSRISAQQALQHRYFSTPPEPTRSEDLPRPSTCPRPNALKSASNLLNQVLNGQGHHLHMRPHSAMQPGAATLAASLMKPPPNRKRASEAFQHGDPDTCGAMSGVNTAPASKRSRTAAPDCCTGVTCAMSIGSDARCLWPDMSPATCLPMSLDPSTLSTLVSSSQGRPLYRPRLNTRELHYLRQRTCELGQLLGIAAQEEAEAAAGAPGAAAEAGTTADSEPPSPSLPPATAPTTPTQQQTAAPAVGAAAGTS